MELHPILECGDKPNFKLWYVISSAHAPSPRVGQACTFKHSSYSLYIVGGADPSNTYKDVYSLNLLNQTWTRMSIKDVEERYEHCILQPSSNPNSLCIFGGANKASNLNSMQQIDTDSGSCTNVNSSGVVPSPRTMHSAASDGDMLYVWGGGHMGSNPVLDLQLHVFDYTKQAWSQPVIKGKIPSARHGHVTAVVGKTLYIHGGMAGTTFHKDLHAINLTDYICSKLKPRGDCPSSRAAHSACVYKKSIYVFGGMSTEGALDDMYQFKTGPGSWIKMTFDSPPPAPRLDHSMTLVNLPHRDQQKEEYQSESNNESGITVEKSGTESGPNIVPLDMWGSGESNSVVAEVSDKLVKLGTDDSNEASVPDVETQTVPACIVFGGMDASGNIYNDVLVLRLDEES